MVIFLVNSFKDTVEMPNKNETKYEAFKRLAETRTGNAIEQIHRIGNLSNKRHYDYKAEDIKKIVNALRKSITSIENKFNESEITEKKFTL